jgi:ABC-type transport system substrate-binding protein
MDSFLERWVKATEPAQQERLLVEFHEIVYEEFPIIKIANAALLDGVRTDLVGYESWADMRLWNTGLASPTTS